MNICKCPVQIQRGLCVIDAPFQEYYGQVYLSDMNQIVSSALLENCNLQTNSKRLKCIP